MLSILFLISGIPTPPPELYRYLAKPDDSYAHRVLREDEQGTTIELTSQTWQGRPWRHTIILRQPRQLAAKGTGILYITGDGPRDGDYAQLSFFSEATGMPVAMLFDIPNQPLWDMREDDLIAHTFERYLATGDADWPLLFPMTKSALRAMDAVQTTTKDSPNPLRKFVITGASKRGWTTWFVGAAKDRRVIGIAPMVYDNLNVAAQMPHQIATWGKYSEQIEDYTRRGLQQKLSSEPGQKLASIIDPYSYRGNIRVPTLIVTGGNDRYWAADAMRLYWNDLRQPKWAKTVPNVGHDLGGGLEAANSVGAFARSLAGAFRMPKLEASSKSMENGSIDVAWRSDGQPVDQVSIWKVASPTLDFRDVRWEKALVIPGEGKTRLATTTRVPNPPGQNAAVFVEVRYKVAGRTFSLTTPVSVIKK